MTPAGSEHEPPRSTVREYPAPDILVQWEPRFCIHSANCIRSLPDVFDRQKRPWIRPTEAAAEAIARTIARCPSGALHFRRLDGGPAEDPDPAVSVSPQPNGPLYVRGRVTVGAEDGSVVREDVRMALCRCGASRHKPFCDGSHSEVGFRSAPP